MLQIYQKFQKLSLGEMQTATRRGLKKALKAVEKQAKINLRAKVNGVSKKNKRFQDTLLRGVRTTRVFINRDNTLVGKVRIDSNRKAGSGSYRLPMLEKGTQYRYTKSGSYRCKITERNFFQNAMQQQGANFGATILEEVNNAIDKINSKK